MGNVRMPAGHAQERAGPVETDVRKQRVIRTINTSSKKRGYRGTDKMFKALEDVGSLVGSLTDKISRRRMPGRMWIDLTH